MGIIRKTQSLALILEEFERNGSALSAIELIKRLDTNLNKTTIYRVLERLEDDGVLHSFPDKNGIKWYAKCDGCSTEGHVDTHPHFQCTQCGNIECLPVEVNIPELPNRKISHSQILLHGQCEKCSMLA